MTFTKKSSFQNAANALFLNIFEIQRFRKISVTIFLTNILKNQRHKKIPHVFRPFQADPSVDVAARSKVAKVASKIRS